MSARTPQLARLVRLDLRRDRLRLPLWVAGVAAFVVYVFAAYAALVTDRDEVLGVIAMLSGPLGAVMGGPGYGMDASVTYASLFAGVYWLYLLVGVALMNVLLVTRHVRAEEETGRADLVAAGAVRRTSPTSAALIVAVLANLAVGAVVALLLGAFAPRGGDLAVPAGEALPSALLTGLATASLGWAFAGIAALTSQLVVRSRAAAGLAGALLALAYAVRAVGDLLEPGGSWVSWLSPLAWAQQTRVFVDPRWWPAALPLLLGTVTALAALAVAARRDVGAGLVGVRRGPVAAGAFGRTSLGLAARIHRAALLGWGLAAVATAILYGLLTGTVVEALPALPPELGEIFAGGSGQDVSAGVVLGYVEFVLLLLALLIAAATLAGLGRVRSEEVEGRAATVLATPVRRGLWSAEHLCVLAIAAAILHLAVGVALGLSAWAVAPGVDVGRVLAASVAHLPATLVVLGCGALAAGLAPRVLGLVWVLVIHGVLTQVFGDLIGLPDWVASLSPWEWTPRVLSEDGTRAWAPLLGQSGAALALAALGVAGFRRRDLVG